MVEVCTVWAPRPHHEKWDPIYPRLLDLQRRSALRWDATHTTITDDPNCKMAGALYTPLNRSLMRAMIEGVIVRLRRLCDRDLVFVDVDCLIARECESAFDGSFDLGLTRRHNSDGVYINNGAMYIAKDGRQKAARFFERALDLCGDHWGADQEAITLAAAPVPTVECVEMRGDLRIAFLSMRTYNAVPKREGRWHDANPYVVHFKGATPKHWMNTYADMFIFNGEVVDQ